MKLQTTRDTTQMPACSVSFEDASHRAPMKGACTPVTCLRDLRPLVGQVLTQLDDFWDRPSLGPRQRQRLLHRRIAPQRSQRHLCHILQVGVPPSQVRGIACLNDVLFSLIWLRSWHPTPAANRPSFLYPQAAELWLALFQGKQVCEMASSSTLTISLPCANTRDGTSHCQREHGTWESR